MREGPPTLFAERFPWLLDVARLLRGYPRIAVPPGKYAALLEYPPHCESRWGHGRPSHPELSRIIGGGRERYASVLRSFLPLAEELAGIPRDADLADPAMPHWGNGWLPDLDGLAIYAWLALAERSLYFEVGSGNSTKFARRALKARNRRTQIVSIDPHPRAEIDAICDEVIRSPLQAVDVSLFDRLGPGDVLFVDNSHYAFMGSDVTVFIFDVLPRLRPGVLVGVHDFFLPDDYPPNWQRRLYNEQYLLGCWLLGGGRSMEILLPAWFASNDTELSTIIAPLLGGSGLAGRKPWGSALWFQVTRG
jgi:hypothetical protein